MKKLLDIQFYELVKTSCLPVKKNSFLSKVKYHFEYFWLSLKTFYPQIIKFKDEIRFRIFGFQIAAIYLSTNNSRYNSV